MLKFFLNWGGIHITKTRPTISWFNWWIFLFLLFFTYRHFFLVFLYEKSSRRYFCFSFTLIKCFRLWIISLGNKTLSIFLKSSHQIIFRCSCTKIIKIMSLLWFWAVFFFIKWSYRWSSSWSSTNTTSTWARKLTN